MKVVLLLVACFVLLVSSQKRLTQFREVLGGAPGHNDECYDAKAYAGEKYAQLGESWITAGCQLATCFLKENYRNEMVPWLNVTGCIQVEIQRGEKCRIAAGDRTKKYPNCCPKKQCIVNGRRKTFTVTEE